MSLRQRTLLASGAGLVALCGALFWAAHRAAPQAVQRARNIGLPAASPQAAPAPSLDAPPLPAAAASPPASSVPTPESEAALMNELRAFKDSDPEFAIERAREGNRRFPDSADAPERSSILIHALASAGRASEARGEAEDMINRYPDSEWVREIERFTGAHRHRNVHLNADGQLAFD
ncbi:MAG TPA: hypothetical protein VK745_28865 [Polyangiaceae bacterium]|nr:hypothetical protein [Polyangiaceae bacterium]